MKRINLIFIGLLISLLSGFVFYSSGEAFDAPSRYGDWHMFPGMMGSWGTGGFGMIFMTVFWLLAIFGLIFLLKWIFPFKKDKIESDLTAIEILKQRYARGEIDKAEFESKKQTLTN